jgi:hypothetical protein
MPGRPGTQANAGYNKLTPTVGMTSSRAWCHTSIDFSLQTVTCAQTAMADHVRPPSILNSNTVLCKCCAYMQRD